VTNSSSNSILIPRLISIIQTWYTEPKGGLTKLTPARIKSELARLKFPEPNLPANVIVLRSDNAGSGLIAMLAQDVIGADQINLALCAPTERIMAAQVLITTDPVFKNELVDRLKNSFSLPDAVPFYGYRPAIQYPLPRITYADDGHWMAEAPISKPCFTSPPQASRLPECSGSQTRRLRMPAPQPARKNET
jgi:hypothetical protein